MCLVIQYELVTEISYVKWKNNITIDLICTEKVNLSLKFISDKVSKLERVTLLFC